MSAMCPPILVGVDEATESELALWFAAQEGLRQLRAVKLVHAVQEAVPAAAVLAPLPDNVRQVEEQLLRPCAQRVRELVAGRLPVSTAISSGSAARVLLEHSASASSVVLGHRVRSGLGRAVNHSTAVAVAARAHCPVVSVPATWHPDVNHGRVLVGVDGSTRSSAALGAAFDAAHARGASLTVIHAWRLPDQYDAVVGAPVLRQEWTEESGVILSEILAGWCSQYPDVSVDVELHYERPVAAMTAAADNADLVVLGRHGDHPLFGFPLGSIAAALIRHTRTPIMVAPDPSEAGTP
jgi:nucleotide-binding universal stress UspA family protein